jgi:hypothetical protein
MELKSYDSGSQDRPGRPGLTAFTSLVRRDYYSDYRIRITHELALGGLVD